MRQIVLIDGNAVGYLANYSTPISYSGMNVQAINGSLSLVRRLKVAMALSTFVVLWDGRAKFRYEIFPEYKSNRELNPKLVKIREEYKKQRPDIQKAFSLLGLTQVTAFNFEADDLAAQLSRRAYEAGDHVMLATSDKDWLQLVNDRVFWHDIRKGYTVRADNFKEVTGYDNVRQFVEAKALHGDVSDAIPGVGGIGEKGAKDLLTQYGSFTEFLKNADEKELNTKLLRLYRNERNAQDIARHDVFYRNMKLMDLSAAPRISDLEVSQSHLDVGAFKMFCEDFGFMNIAADVENFVEPFNRCEVSV